MKSESKKAGVILGFIGVSWVSRGTLLLRTKAVHIHGLMDLHGSPRVNGCTWDSMEVHGGESWCVKCRLSLYRAGSNLYHSAPEVSYVKGTEWGIIGAKKEKTIRGRLCLFPRRERAAKMMCFLGQPLFSPFQAELRVSSSVINYIVWWLVCWICTREMEFQKDVSKEIFQITEI